ncbi:hypothetical protein IFM89_021835 [Coptis chinensis]|uniref:Uncharacterized protein n=1 Tax=Coptis chinensis TaxID=261450 RepID=A0A835I465_9MAGN|nr:hypothetical protein IFM89_021835 [Coptis chinensis]
MAEASAGIGLDEAVGEEGEWVTVGCDWSGGLVAKLSPFMDALIRKKRRQTSKGLCASNNFVFMNVLLRLFIFFLEKAYEESQKYKEGKYILEKERVLKDW